MFFAYTLRNIIARRRTTVPAGLAIFGTVAAVTAMLALLEGIGRTMDDSARAANAMVMSQGAQNEATSTLPLDLINAIKVFPGVAQKDGHELVSPELVMPLRVRQPDGTVKSVTLRGVDPIALDVHGVQVSDGKLPERGAPGLIIGPSLLGTAPGFQVGGGVFVGRHTWPVVGRLNAPDTIFESEIWCDRQALQDELRRPIVSSMYVGLSGADKMDAFLGEAKKTKFNDKPLMAQTEKEFFQGDVENMDLLQQAVISVIVLLLLGAIFAATNAMYSSFLARANELGTLITLGFSRGRVCTIVLLESLVLAGLSGVLGLAVASLLNGRALDYQETALSLTYRAVVSPRVLLGGLLCAAVIGLLGGLLGVFHTARLNVLEALRAT